MEPIAILRGRVIHGKGLGRTVGMPTANLDVSKSSEIPPEGVYASIAHVRSGSYYAVTNIGTRPSVDSSPRLTIETNIMDFDEDIYGEDYQELLAEILVHAITRDNDLSDPKELENIGFFSVDEIYPNNNFYVDDQGITYTFNEYEVAAYVVGPVHVHLSFDEVSVLLKPDTPVARLAGKS